MSNNTTIFLKDYQVPAYLINRTELSFELETQVKQDTVTIVKSRLEILRNDKSRQADKSLRLHGQSLQLKSIMLNGQILSQQDYQVDLDCSYIYYTK